MRNLGTWSLLARDSQTEPSVGCLSGPETGGLAGVMAEQQSGLESLLGLQPGDLQVLKMEGLWCPKALGRAWRLYPYLLEWGEGGMFSLLGTSNGWKGAWKLSLEGSTEKQS